MRIDAQKSGEGGSGIIIGGVHIPDATQIFRHHPSRPSPQGPPHQPIVPTTAASGYLKYLAAGGLCATITHVPSICKNAENRAWRRQLTWSRLGFKSTLR